MATKAVPRHIAIIMDGNGRWAQERHLPRIMGHRAGVKAVREAVKGCIELGVPYLTLYAFSQENWKRPRPEVTRLMQLLDRFLDSELASLVRQKIRFRAIGRLEALPPAVQAKVGKVTERTAGFRRLTLVIALNYGSRREIVDAARSVWRHLAEGKIGPRELERFDEGDFASHLYTAGLPDPDLLIRTSGEMRLSNFLLWQCSYSEIIISKKYWPEFTREDLHEAVREFGQRERRFGAV
jgi:undecaprenyl diphosphate synthase